MLKMYKKFLNEKIEYNELIEFSILQKPLGIEKIKELVDKAISKNIKIINTIPDYLDDIKIFIDKNPIKIAISVDFPIGNMKNNEKVKIINNLIIKNVDEIDLTINSKIIEQNKKIDSLIEELTKISEKCHKNSIIFKLVTNINDISLENLKILSNILTQSGIDYIQTSTGNKTDIKKLKYLRAILPNIIKIKTAGEIINTNDINQYIKYSDRIATSRINVI